MYCCFHCVICHLLVTLFEDASQADRADIRETVSAQLSYTGLWLPQQVLNHGF